jgi:NAD(P)-dependent dehydrogenase (short-subunit alcohol dehydrogenase family)
VSKLAATGVTVALAGELAGDNIRVNAISPGFVGSADTLAECTPERLMAIMAALGTSLPAEVVAKCSSEDLVSVIRSLQLVQREGTVDDVVRALLFLCSDSAGFVTGETLKVAGGAAIGF